MPEPRLDPAKPCRRWRPTRRPPGRAGQTASRLQRKHRRLLAARHRIPAQRSCANEQLSVYPEYTRVKPALAAFFKVAAGRTAAHQRHRRSHSGSDQHLCRRRRRSHHPAPVLRHVPFLRRSGRREDQRSRLRPPARSRSRWQQLLAAITPATRAILISNPNNPTGTATDLEADQTASSKRAPQAAVLIDEAYYEFCGITALPLIAELSESVRQPDIFQGLRHGRDAHGLPVLAGGQRPVPAQSAIALQREHARGAGCRSRRAGYGVRRELRRPKRWPRASCFAPGSQKLGIEQAPSAANFILGYFGDRAIEVRDALRDKAILVRDRSYEIPGGVRITAGTREQAHGRPR